MTDAIIGVSVLAAIVGAVILWQKFTSALGNKATQTILRPKDHKAGQELVSQRHTFAVSASVSEVRTAILEQVSARTDAPAVKPALYLVDSSNSYVVLDYGTKLQTVFRVTVHMIESDGGTKGFFNFSNWMEGSGIVARQSEMKQVIADIKLALRNVDPQASV